MAKKMRIRSLSNEEIVQVVDAFREHSKQERKDRLQLNIRNWEAYMGMADWSHKTEDQSTEFLPKTGSAVEQFAAFVKRALIQFGDWFSVDGPEDPVLPPHKVHALLAHMLDHLAVGDDQHTDFASVMSLAVKSMLMESSLTLKIHGGIREEPSVYPRQELSFADFEEGKKDEVDEKFEAQEGVEAVEDIETMDIEAGFRRAKRNVWRLKIDQIPDVEYYPDPTGRGLFEIHEVEKDLHDVKEWARKGVYDKEVVDKIVTDFAQTDEDHKRKPQENHKHPQAPKFRKRVVLTEFWGTLLDNNGNIVGRNLMLTIANRKHVIRKPRFNPLWHNESPFVSRAMIEVPGSVWGKSLYDDAVPLNHAANELFNLMTDAAIASVWGVRQLRPEFLEDAGQVSEGVKQGMTLVLKEGTPRDARVLEPLTADRPAAEAMQIFQLIDREFQAASLTNDLKMGFLPPRQVKATEIIQSDQNQGVLLDNFVGDLETGIMAEVLRKAWLNILQHMDELPADEVVEILGPVTAARLANMEPEERFDRFGVGFKFRVSGLSATLAKARDFQKMMSVMQMVQQSPMLFEAFMQKFSPFKALDSLFKALNLDPETLQQSPEEEQMMQQMQQRMQQVQEANGGRMPGVAPAAGDAGNEGMQGEIRQNAEPTQGF